MMRSGNYTRLHRLEELTLRDLRLLDRSRTVVLLPVGMLEEHGEHLPLGTDTYAVDALTLAAAAWLLDGDRSLNVLLMPTLPYSTDPIDLRRPELFTAAGSVWIGEETLRRIVTDLAERMIGYGFRLFFPVGFHSGPTQSRVLDEVCAALRSAHPGVVMFEPLGHVLAGAELDVKPGLATLLGRPLTVSEEVVLKGSIHASMFETSMVLHLRPDLVDPSYKSLRSLEWRAMYLMPDWPGYVGAGPAHANADIGAAVLRWRGVRAAALIRRALDGEDISLLPRHPAWETDELVAAAHDVRLEEGPHIEENPVIALSAEDIARLSEVVQSVDDADVEDGAAQADPQEAQTKLHDTPLSSIMETKPIGRRRPTTDQDDEASS
jgi:creatinine amidohydrolase